MKRIAPFAFVMIFSISGCLTHYDHAIADLEDKINQMETISIASLSEQVSMIEESVADLGTVDEYLNMYIENLEDVSENLSDKIEIVENAIETLKTSHVDYLGELEESLIQNLESVKASLESELEDVDSAIATLSLKHLEIQQSIEDLQNYVDNELAASEEWVASTYATLEQYNALQKSLSDVTSTVENLVSKTDALKSELEQKVSTDIAAAVEALKQQVSDDCAAAIEKAVDDVSAESAALIEKLETDLKAAYQTDLAAAISESEARMQQWVNEKLQADYYTITQTLSQLEALKSELSSDDDDLLEKITSVEKALTEANAALTEAYKAAIKDAIENNNGVIESKISEAVIAASNNLQGKIDVLGTTIDEISIELGLINGRVDALEMRIQSIRYLPEYIDGEVIVGKYSKSVTLDFMITPFEAAAQLQSLWEAGQDVVGGYAHYVDTRASASPVVMKVKSVTGSTDGLLTVVLAEDESNPLSDGFWSGTQAAFVYVTVDDGNSDVISELIPIKYAGYEIIKEEGQGEEGNKLTYYVDALPGLLKWAYDVNVLGNKNADFVLVNTVEIPQFEIVRDDDARTYAYSDVPITVDPGTGVPSGSNWLSICTAISSLSDSYSGHVNGQGYTIRGLRIVHNNDQVGFIGALHDDSSVKNIVFEDAIVKGKSEVGLIGRSQNGGVVEDVSVNASRIIGTGRVGGVVGLNYRRVKSGLDEAMSYVRNCVTDNQTVISGADETGGICGRNDGAVVIGCTNNADVNGKSSVGGVVGYTCSYNNGGINGYVVASGSTGEATITGTQYAGGIVGYTYLNPTHASNGSKSYVTACYSTSAVTAATGAGSFAATTHSSGYYGQIVASWAVYKEGMNYSGNKKIAFANLISSNHYLSASDITQDIVDDMNQAIDDYNATNGVEQTCPYKWTWTSGEWPTLSALNL